MDGRLVAGWIVSSALAETASAVAAGADFANPVIGTITVVSAEAAVLALTQALLLRSIDARLATRWAVATAIGTLIGRLLQGAAGPFVPSAVLGAVAGVLMAAPQTVAMRGYVAHGAAWLLVRGVAWALAMPLLVLGGNALASLAALPFVWAVAGIVGLFAGIGALVGVAEGTCIARLLALRRTDERRAPHTLEAATG